MLEIKRGFEFELQKISGLCFPTPFVSLPLSQKNYCEEPMISMMSFVLHLLHVDENTDLIKSLTVRVTFLFGRFGGAPLGVGQVPLRFVDSAAKLQAAAAELSQAAAVGVDVEHNHIRCYQGLTCLLQLTTGEAPTLHKACPQTCRGQCGEGDVTTICDGAAVFEYPDQPGVTWCHSEGLVQIWPFSFPMLVVLRPSGKVARSNINSPASRRLHD